MPVDPVLTSANILYRYSNFVVPVYHYPQFKANTILYLVQYFYEIELTHLKHIYDNVFVMFIYWTNYLVSKYPQ